ncbi:MAG: hypothetical protein SPF83_12785 [Butyricimonas virosa]|uniref:hypothetical protein n=1 Tax=Butyricimonas virosa TaxID=544645 RepID=UPI00242A99DB|nr:hypothetical protein [Butyricimonas virosa]MDY5534522.1 hypothetical protein [Butyricimonas virosa]
MKDKFVRIIVGISLCFITVGVICQCLNRRIKFQVMNVALLDSLVKTDADFIMLTIGHRDCKVCQKLKFSKKMAKIRLVQEYFDITSHTNNKLLGQALSVKGCPSTYVFDKNLQIRGVVSGMINRETRLRSACESSNVVFDLSVEEVDKSKLSGMLSNTFRSLLNYWEGDIEEAKTYALNSLSYGSYFFNNYLLFLIYKMENDNEKMLFYREQALQYTSSTNKIIYEDLIRQLEK